MRMVKHIASWLTHESTLASVVCVLIVQALGQSIGWKEDFAPHVVFIWALSFSVWMLCEFNEKLENTTVHVVAMIFPACAFLFVFDKHPYYIPVGCIIGMILGYTCTRSLWMLYDAPDALTRYEIMSHWVMPSAHMAAPIAESPESAESFFVPQRNVRIMEPEGISFKKVLKYTTAVLFAALVGAIFLLLAITELGGALRNN